MISKLLCTPENLYYSTTSRGLKKEIPNGLTSQWATMIGREYANWEVCLPYTNYHLHIPMEALVFTGTTAWQHLRTSVQEHWTKQGKTF